MLKWHQIDSNLLESGKEKIFKWSDRRLEGRVIAKCILGLPKDCELRDFKFELSVFGIRSECFFAAQFQYDAECTQQILISAQAEAGSASVENALYRDDLLNLFGKEEAAKPSISMLTEFLKVRAKDFQVQSEISGEFWIAKWSDVNSWAIFWSDQSKFNCLAKMSG